MMLTADGRDALSLGCLDWLPARGIRLAVSRTPTTSELQPAGSNTDGAADSEDF